MSGPRAGLDEYKTLTVEKIGSGTGGYEYSIGV